MIDYNQDQSKMTITIPVSGIAELYSYQKGIMSLLSMVELENCDDELQENLAYVYRLMNHLLLDDHFLEHVDLLLSKATVKR
ncbi:MAG: hypothetical protein AAFO69_00515 [Bacteroidota bacterium]